MEDTVTGYTFGGYIFTWRTVWEGMLDKRIWQSRIKEKHNVVDIRTNSLGEKCQPWPGASGWWNRMLHCVL